MTNKIDFVVTWVDGNDDVWREEKKKYEIIEKGDARDSRYREWDTLRYWFRGIEKFAPWVNKVFFVTCGHYPEWLNLHHEKLVHVSHKDFIPEKYLPTFSCRPIEFNLHKIPGLSEKFVYFNDDMYILRPVSESDFFKNDLPCDAAILDATSITTKGRSNEKIPLNSIYSTLLYNTAVINGNFNKNRVIRENLSKWFSPHYGLSLIRTVLLLPWGEFTGFKSAHLPYSYLKSSFDEVWNYEEEALNQACSHRFRNNQDVSSRLISDWQLVTGKFAPRSNSIGKQFYINNSAENNEQVYKIISGQKYKLICINDEYSGDNFDQEKKKMKKAFQTIFPEKSSFEV